MKHYIVSLNLTKDQVLAYYQGQVDAVVARDAQGVTIQFPAKALSKVVTEHGVWGEFIISVDNNNKFIDIKKKK